MPSSHRDSKSPLYLGQVPSFDQDYEKFAAILPHISLNSYEWEELPPAKIQ